MCRRVLIIVVCVLSISCAETKQQNSVPDATVAAGAIHVSARAASVGQSVTILGDQWPREQIQLCVYAFSGQEEPPFLSLYNSRSYKVIKTLAVSGTFGVEVTIPAKLTYDNGSDVDIRVGTTIVFFTKEPHGAHTGPSVSITGPSN